MYLCQIPTTGGESNGSGEGLEGVKKDIDRLLGRDGSGIVYTCLWKKTFTTPYCVVNV